MLLGKETARCVGNHFRVLRRALDDPRRQKGKILIHHLVSDFMHESVISEGAIFEISLPPFFKADARKRNHEDLQSAHVNSAGVLRSSGSNVVGSRFEKLCLIALQPLGWPTV